MKILLIILVLLIGTNCLFAQEDTYQTITARVDGVLYKAIYKSSDLSISIINPRGKVINCIGDGAVWRLRFIDFNRDGYKDLFIEYISNVPGDNLLLLYNDKMRTFVEVEGFENFLMHPDLEMIIYIIHTKELVAQILIGTVIFLRSSIIKQSRLAT
jgi:hypothetical protein